MRRKLLPLVVGMALLGATVAAAQTSRNIVVEGKRFGAFYDNAWAVVIGINDYQHPRVPKLNYAVNDARSVARVLTAEGFRKDRITMLLDGQATKAAIERVLGDELRTKVRADGRVLVFFAGHGKTDHLRSSDDEGYLVPVDSDPSRLFSTGISMTSIRQISDRLAAKQVLYIADTCYSGFAVFNRSISDDLFEEMVRKPAMQILTAWRQQDEAQERAGHGVFTEALLRGLQGEAFAGKDRLSLEELARGGSWDDEPKDLNVSRRRSQDADERGDKIGFRCAKSAP